jgi:hypothetical protein
MLQSTETSAVPVTAAVSARAPPDDSWAAVGVTVTATPVGEGWEGAVPAVPPQAVSTVTDRRRTPERDLIGRVSLVLRRLAPVVTASDRGTSRDQGTASETRSGRPG